MPEYNSIHTGKKIDEGISAVPRIQADTTENWVTLNDLDNRVRALEAGGGGLISAKDVNFYDPYGNLVAAWTLAEAQAATSLPNAPTLDRLTFQEWNWTLEDIKATGRTIDVGGTYITSSGASEIDITLTAVTGLSIKLDVYNDTAGNTISVDWGDGIIEDATTTSAGIKTFTHTYADTGNYTISIDSPGTYSFVGSPNSPYNMFNQSPNHTCTEIRCGVRCSKLDNNSYNQCLSLTSVIIPKHITSIGSSVFYGCSSLRHIAIPNSVTSLDANSLFYCINLRRVILPNSITSISNNVFYNNFSLTNIILPKNITTIGVSAFLGNTSIVKYIILRTVPPTLSSATAFSSINKICIIEVPKGSLAAYQTATNWTAYADYMREATT